MTEANCSYYPLSELSEGMEVHIHHIHNRSTEQPTTSFNVAVNHTHCVASYDLDEVKGDKPYLLGPTRRMFCSVF
jgi:hypothetical protein